MKDKSILKNVLRKKTLQGRRLVLSFLLTFVVSLGAYAQESIKGSVFDDTGEPLIGATVMAEGNSNIGTATDIDGNFVFKSEARDKA